VHSVTPGIDALGEVTVQISPSSETDDRVFGGYGADTDIIVASAKAYLAALNRMYAEIGPREEPAPKQTQASMASSEDSQEHSRKVS
jgi:2-isopropylmalate synthase